MSFEAVPPNELFEASERAGGRPTGRIIPLGCLENRVFWLPSDDGSDHIVKVYRPDRWTEAQLDVEHDFVCELDGRDIAVAPPLDLGGGFTIGRFELRKIPMYYAVYPRLTGRMRDELSLQQCEQLGEILNEVHTIARDIEWTAFRQPKDNVPALEAWLEESPDLPGYYRGRALRWLERIRSARFEDNAQLIHGDCHMGNIMWEGDDPYLIDFDDCGVGWVGQDLWLVAPGDDDYHREQRRVLLSGYGRGILFHELEERLVMLRALRMLNYARWIAQRHPDPAFVHAYPQYGKPVFFTDECKALDELEGLLLIA
jgi:Ser/Thr protein kinase RdoA (MazF antagonist)